MHASWADLYHSDVIWEVDELFTSWLCKYAEDALRPKAVVHTYCILSRDVPVINSMVLMFQVQMMPTGRLGPYTRTLPRRI
jgi:hypothetical protein